MMSCDEAHQGKHKRKREDAGESGAATARVKVALKSMRKALNFASVTYAQASEAQVIPCRVGKAFDTLAKAGETARKARVAIEEAVRVMNSIDADGSDHAIAALTEHLASFATHMAESLNPLMAFSTMLAGFGSTEADNTDPASEEESEWSSSSSSSEDSSDSSDESSSSSSEESEDPSRESSDEEPSYDDDDELASELSA